MTIITVSKKNTLRLPKEVVGHLRGTRHLQVRLNASGLTLLPVQIQPALSPQAIPEPKGR